MNRILLFLLLCFSLFSCDKPKEIPPEILENIIYESLLTDAMISNFDALNSKRPELNYYEPIVKKYDYTIEDIKYTIERMVQRKSEVLGAVTGNVKNRFAQKSELYKKISRTTDNWEIHIDEYLVDTLYSNSKGIKIKTIKEIDSVYLRIPLDGKGRYVLSMTYNVGNEDKNRVRYLNGEFVDSLIEFVHEQPFTKVIDAVGSRLIEHQFIIDNPSNGNVLSLNLVAKNSIHNNSNDQNKTSNPKISITDILLIKKPLGEDGSLRLYTYLTGMKFPTKIVENRQLIHVRSPYRIKERNNKITEDKQERI